MDIILARLRQGFGGQPSLLIFLFDLPAVTAKQRRLACPRGFEPPTPRLGIYFLVFNFFIFYQQVIAIFLSGSFLIVTILSPKGSFSLFS